MNIQDKAKQILKEDITYKKLENDTQRVIIDSDSIIYKTVQYLHDGLLPHDWIFNKVDSVLTLISEIEAHSVDELRDEILTCIPIDIYNHELLDWEKIFSQYTDEAREEWGSKNLSVIEQIQQGQSLLLERIVMCLIDKLNEEVN